MSRALTTGAAGGVIGAITASVGMIWLTLLWTQSSTANTFNAFASTLNAFYVDCKILMHLIPLIIDPPPGHASLLVFSFVLAVLLIVSLVLSGVGFYGVYRRGGGGAGLLALIAAITGGTLGATLTTLGNITGNHSIIPCFCSNGGTYFFNLPVYVGPNYLFVWVGMLVVAVTFILLGSASIAVRASTATPSVALKAGIISIIGACFLGFPPIPWLWFFWLLAFTLMLVAFVLWTVVFYSSREAIF